MNEKRFRVLPKSKDSQVGLDAVPVIRCRDCRFGEWDSEPDDALVCRKNGMIWRRGDDFCSDGESKR